MARYYVPDSRLEDYNRITGGDLPDGWGFRLVDGCWWMVDTNDQHPDLEAQVAEIAEKAAACFDRARSRE